jgi:hypothetical protein
VLVAAAALLAALYARGARAGEPRAPVTVAGFDRVEWLRFADADGDGVLDLLEAAGHEVRAWKGAAGKPFPVDATWTWKLPAGASFAWPTKPAGKPGAGEPRLAALSRGSLLVAAPGDEPSTQDSTDTRLDWEDPYRVVLAEWIRDGQAFVPTPIGFLWYPEWATNADRFVPLAFPLRRKTVPSSTSLEEPASVTTEWPDPFLVPSWKPAGGAPAAFFLGDAEISAFVAGRRMRASRVTWASGFLPPTKDGRALLVDFDADGTPDLVHEDVTNLEGTYTFLRVPPPDSVPPAGEATPAVKGGDIRPPRGQVRLTGFQIPADYVDLDGDGRKDFVVTTIEIDAKNVMGAVMGRKVKAVTRAFLNRSGRGGGEIFFAPTPDAEVDSTIGVAIRFSFTGAIDVKRSFTILAKGDLDGDGRRDLVIRTGPSTLSVHRGTASGVWATEAVEVAIPPLGDSPDVEGFVADVDGDRKDDLVLLYRAGAGGRDRTVVLASP